MRSSLRPLLPSPTSEPASQSTSEPTSQPSPNPISPFKRQSASLACNSCRRRKVKCTGERPACTVCVKYRVPCEYEAKLTSSQTLALKRKSNGLERKCSAYEEFHRLLQSSSREEACDILDRLRNGADVESVLRQVQSAKLLLQIYPKSVARHHYHLGDYIRIPTYLQRGGNPFLGSAIFQKYFNSNSAPNQLSPSRASVERASGCSNLLETPYHVAKLIESRLDRVQPSKWTTVISDDQLLRELLATYFLNDYPWFTYFHKDYFLYDMEHGQTRFCSSLLVNAVLATSCHAHSAVSNEFWDPDNLCNQFLAEAKKLFELESTKAASITRIQAAAIMYWCYSKNSLDKIGYSYYRQAIDMAQSMNLFDRFWRPESDAWRIVQTLTVFGLYRGQSQQAFHYRHPTLLSGPPQIPLMEDFGDCGEIWIKYPDAEPIPLHFGELWKAMVDFNAILGEIACHQYPRHGAGDGLSFELAINCRSKLQIWFDTLPVSLAPENIVLPLHFQIHMHYFAVLTGLFELFLTPESASITPSSMSLTASRIVQDAQLSLQTLLRLYYICHGPDTYGVSLAQFAMLIGFGAVKALQSSDISPEAADTLHATVCICASILQSLGHKLYLIDVVFRLFYNSLAAKEVSSLRRLRIFDTTSEGKLAIVSQYVQSEWPIPTTEVSDKPPFIRLDEILESNVDSQ